MIMDRLGFAAAPEVIFESYLHKTPPLDKLFVVSAGCFTTPQAGVGNTQCGRVRLLAVRDAAERLCHVLVLGAPRKFPLRRRNHAPLHSVQRSSIYALSCKGGFLG